LKLDEFASWITLLIVDKILELIPGTLFRAAVVPFVMAVKSAGRLVAGRPAASTAGVTWEGRSVV
jgi:hypothetical protein